MPAKKTIDMPVRDYEVIYVLRITLDADAIDKKISKYEEIVTKAKGTVDSIEKWGKRDLITPFKKFRYDQFGYFVMMNFSSTKKALDDLNHAFRIDEDMMRDMIILKEIPSTKPVKERKRGKSE